VQECIWFAPQVLSSDVNQVRTLAQAYLHYLADPIIPNASLNWPISDHPRMVILPMVVKEGPVFGVLCLQCVSLDEFSVTLLHALGNHIALALDHQYQLEEQKKATLKIKLLYGEIEKASQFRKLAECVPQMVWKISDEGEITYINRRWIQYTGVDIKRGSFQEWMNLCHPDDRVDVLNAWNKALSEQGAFEVENRLRRLDGSYRWHISRAVPEEDDAGKVLGWVGTCTDIDEKRRAQEQLESANGRLSLLYEIAAEIMRPGSSKDMIEKAAGKLSSQLPIDLYVNLLVEPGRVRLKTNVHSGIPESYLPSLEALRFEESLSRQTSLDKDCMELLHDLGMQTCASFPLVSQGRPIGLLLFGSKQHLTPEDKEFLRSVCDQIALALDRTLNEEAKAIAIKDLEKAKMEADSANHAKSLFLANMSHEIRTPIGVILGFADLASSAEYPENERVAALQKIKRNGQELAQLIDDILDLTKVETGHLEIERTAVDLEDLLHQLTSLLHFKAGEKGINLTIETSSDVPNRMMTDPLRLRQCLINVIGNAIKFTDQGGVHVKVCSARNAQNRRLLKFIVRDTGIGLTEEQKNKLFRNFSQANASTSRKFGGTGLGLALSRNLARAMGGDLYLEESALGKGSTFVLTVAISELPKRMSRQSEICETSESAVTKLDGIKVLLVEDAPDNQTLIKRYLEMSGAEVSLASDGREGVEKALQGSHDLVLMDIQMPFVDGYEATLRLRQSGYKKPVIALTANAMRGDKERSMQAGFTDHLSKPINPGALLKAVISAVKRA
jgi:PAS domain S-box-containing protein